MSCDQSPEVMFACCGKAVVCSLVSVKTSQWSPSCFVLLLIFFCDAFWVYTKFYVYDKKINKLAGEEL